MPTRIICWALQHTNRTTTTSRLNTLRERSTSDSSVASYHSNLGAAYRAHHIFLPMLAGLVSQRKDTVRILDFGGATGTALLHLTAGMGDPSAIELNVVETESACRIGERLWPNEPRIKFHRAIADVPREIDIVHINGTLQYIDDYRAVLEELCAFRASYFMLPRLSAGDISTYATAQMNLWGDVVAKVSAEFDPCGLP